MSTMRKVLLVDAMTEEQRYCWSYLVGYFLGDGTSFVNTGHQNRNFRLCAYKHDRPRLEESLRKLGVALNWLVNWKDGNVDSTWATIPRRVAVGWWFERIPGVGNNGMIRVPRWVELVYKALYEGLFDADGHIGNVPRVRKSGHVYRQRAISFRVVSKGLRDDFSSYLREQGFDFLSEASYKRKAPHRTIHGVTVNSNDYGRFKQMFKLQDYKQGILESL